VCVAAGWAAGRGAALGMAMALFLGLVGLSMSLGPARGEGSAAESSAVGGAEPVQLPLLPLGDSSPFALPGS
jgi:hypothetical protein